MSRRFSPLAAVLAAAAAVLAAGASPALGAFCHGKPSPDAQPNLLPFWTGQPELVRTVPNGALYMAGEIPVVHLWGSPYEKGFAHGSLMREEVNDLLDDAIAYFEDQFVGAINKTGHSLHIPQDVIDWVAKVGLDTALDLTYDATVKYTGAYFYDEMRGLADGSGASYLSARRVHMIGELTKGDCSMFGAWGAATASEGGKLLQLRALDWDMDGPFRQRPQLTVYHNNGSAEQGHSFVNVGWSGWIASISGMSEVGTGISEIGVAFPDASFGNESRVGIPFTNILKDMVQFDRTLADAERRLTDAHRTCDLILGFGDAKPGGGFRGVQYSYSDANFIDDTNLIPKGDWHPPIENVVYFGMDWLCPNYNSVLAAQLNAFHGNITAEASARHITAITQTGNLHNAVYDLTDMKLLVSVAATNNQTGPLEAYSRTFHEFDMTQVFATPPPPGARV